MNWTSTVTEDGRLLLQINHDGQYEASASGLQRGTMQQQTPNQRRRSLSIRNNTTSVWSAICAFELGILTESDLMHIKFVSYADILSIIIKNTEESPDLETSDCEDDVDCYLCKFVNFFNDSWPFIDPSLIPQITSKKPGRRRKLKRKRWTPRRYSRKVQQDDSAEETDDASEGISNKREDPGSPLETNREDLDVSTGETRPAARLSDNNFSLTQPRAQSSAGNENRARSSGSYVTAGGNKVRRAASSRADSKKIAQIDYSVSGYSRFCSSTRQKRERPQSRAELSEYPEYFMNILPVDNDSDGTSEEARKSDYEAPRSDAQSRISSAKLAKSDPLPSNTSAENGIVSRRGRRRNAPPKQSSQKYQLRSNGVHSKIASKRLGRSKRTNRYTLRRQEKIHYDADKSSCEESPPESASNLKDLADDASGDAKARKRCDCYIRRHSGRNIVCTCKRNQKEMSNAIMQEIQAHIHDAADVTKDKDAESAQDTISTEIDVENFSEKSNKDFDQNISMEYDWNDEGESTNVADFQKVTQLSADTSSPKELSTSFIKHRKSRKRKRRLNGSLIDYTFDDNLKTAYHSVFHDCVDTPIATSSLKINMEENWRSEDSGDDTGITETVHSWRQSSLTERSDEKFDSTFFFGRNSDDSASEKSSDNALKTMSGTCYKDRETPDIFGPISGNNSACSDDETEIGKSAIHDKTKNVVTYQNKNRTISGSSSVDLSIVKNEKDVKKDAPNFKEVRRRSRKNMKADSESTSMQKRSKGKGNDSESDDDKKEYVTRRKTRALIKTGKENYIGKLVWGSCGGWWPALIIDASHAGMAPTPGKLWVYWLGDAQISALAERTQIEPFSTRLEQRLSQPRNKRVSLAIDTTIQILRQYFETPLTKPYYDWIRRNVDELERLDQLTFHPYPRTVQRRLDELREKNAQATEKFILKQQRKSPETAPPSKKQVVEKHKEPRTSSQIEEERLPLRNQYPGVIAWAKIAGHNWWPAMIIDYRDCCLKEPSFGCQWIMWYGDYKVSEVRHLEFLKFHKGLEKLRDYIKTTTKQSYIEGVIQASKDYCSRLGCNTDNWTLDNVLEYFSNMNNIHVPNNDLQVSDSNKIYDKYSDEINKRINQFKAKPDIDDDRKTEIKESNALRRVIAGEVSVKKLCLKCLEFSKGKMEEHPFFIGSLCKECSDEFKPSMFVFGNDDKCFYCTLCAGSGTLLLCDREDCPRVYCTACMKYLICPKDYDSMLTEDPWECFLCRDESRQPVNPVFRPRPDWKKKITGMFRTSSSISDDVNIAEYSRKKPIRVLSLFDGLGTGLLVLLKLGIAVDVYYASEIDNDALMVSSAHFGDRINYLGDVRGITKEKIQEIAPIDLLIGGSPCNDLSLVNPARLGLHNPKGTGILFFDYCRIKKLLKTANKGRHLFWMFENVASMPSKYRLEINKHLGQEPYVIDSADFSPQHRLRLYWHNIPFNPYIVLLHKRQDVQDVLTKHCDRYALVKKIRTVTTRSNSLRCGKAELKPIIMKGESDTLWTTELEEIFGFPRHYTDVKNLSATDRQKLIGRSWSVQTIMAILQPLCSYFKCNDNKKLCTAQGNIFSSQ